MLIPLTRKKFEQLMPSVATGPQYRYYWGKPADFLRRLLISLIGVVVIFLVVKPILPASFGLAEFILAIIIGLYWLWTPVYFATRRNWDCRRYEYAGLWQGEVLDVFVTEELVREEETVNKKGELVVIENRERRLNLEIGDETGFSTQVQVPLKRFHKSIRRGDLAEMVVMSNRPDLSRFTKLSDLYIPDYGIWVSDYPYLQREAFVEVSRQLRQRQSRRGDRPFDNDWREQ